MEELLSFCTPGVKETEIKNYITLNKDVQKDKSESVTYKHLECREKSIRHHDYYVKKNWALILLLPQGVSWQLS